jgi:CRP-like cAMP-binding protein
VNPSTGEPQSQVVAYLRKGKSFGELAIMHAAARNATVVCHTKVSVLSIERDDFIDIFMHVEKGVEPEHIVFLRGVELMSQWPIDKLPYNDPRICLLTYFRKGTVMCKESAKSEWIYFVKQGSCRIIKDVLVLLRSGEQDQLALYPATSKLGDEMLGKSLVSTK